MCRRHGHKHVPERITQRTTKELGAGLRLADEGPWDRSEVSGEFVKRFKGKRMDRSLQGQQDCQAKRVSGPLI